PRTVSVMRREGRCDLRSGGAGQRQSPVEAFMAIARGTRTVEGEVGVTLYQRDRQVGDSVVTDGGITRPRSFEAGWHLVDAGVALSSPHRERGENDQHRERAAGNRD